MSGVTTNISCDCAACTAVLHYLGKDIPGDWTVDTCDCIKCQSLIRVVLQKVGIAGNELHASEGILGNDISGTLGRLKPFVPPSMPSLQQQISLISPVTLSSSSSSSSSVYPGENALGGRTVWTAALSVRGRFPPACSVRSAFGVSETQCSKGAPSLSTRCVIGTHRAHHDFFTRLVRDSKEPFALLRYVDGERMILQGTKVGTSSQAASEDKWWYEGGETRLAKDMDAGLRGHYGEPYFFAFASPADDEVGLRWYMERTEATCGQITYANLWINNFVSFLRAL